MVLTISPSTAPSRAATLTRTPYPTIRIPPSKTPTPTRTLSPNAPRPQADASIQQCKNAGAPVPLEDIPAIEGVIFYTNYFRNRLFALTGSPPRTTEISLPDTQIDSYAFSPDGQWLLAYSERPDDISCYGCAHLPAWLISTDGRVLPRKIDINRIIEFIHRNSFSSSFQHWQFEWVNSRIIQVIVGYGERASFSYAFGYYDIVQGAWWDQPLQNLPGRQSEGAESFIIDHFYDWSELSPDLSRMLYLDNEGNLILWDREQHKELWREYVEWDSCGSYMCPVNAVWSPNSRQVALWLLNDPDNLYLLGRDGEDYFALTRPILPDKTHKLHFGIVPNWSPDGQKLVINSSISIGDLPEGMPTHSFYIFDTQERSFTLRCPRQSSTSGPGLIWSPNGNALASRHDYDTHAPFSLFDLNDLLVYQFRNKLYSAVGWVENFAINWK